MEIEKLRRKERRNKTISIRTYETYSKFMTEKNLSPSKIFNSAVENLMKEFEKKK